MSETIQWTLVALGAAGAAGTWLRAVVALLTHRAQERERRRFDEGR